MPQQTVTLIVASYGAILATAAAIWNGVQIYQSSRRLRIDAAITLDLERVPYKTMFVIVSNLNKRPIRVQSIQGYKNKRDYKKGPKAYAIAISPISWRNALQEGDSVIAKIENYKEWCTGKYGYIFVLDSVGKRWPLSRRTLRKLKEAATGPDKLPMPTITETGTTDHA